MADRNLGYDVEVGYSGEQNARQAVSDLERFQTELDKVDHAARNVGDSTGGIFNKAVSSWTEFSSAIGVVSGALGTAQQVAQQAWDTISRGADLSRTTEQASKLAESIGASWEVLLSDMTNATGGMISQADLAASAVDIIGLGMADTGDEVVRLSKLVGELGWDMQTLTLTLANQSTARLDSLGLSMEDVTDRVDKLKEAGLAADEAFKFAVIEAGEAKLELLGSTADSAAGDVKRLEASWQDLQDTLAQRSADAAAPLLSIAVAEIKVNEAIKEGVLVTNALELAQAKAAVTSSTYREELDKLLVIVEGVSSAERAYRDGLARDTELRNQAAAAAKDRAQAERELAYALNDQKETDPGRSLLVQNTIDARVATYAFKDALEEQSQALIDQADAADAAAERIGNFATSVAAAWGEYVAATQAASGDVFTDAAFDPEQTYDQAQATYEWADSMGYGASALANLAKELGLVTEEAAAYGVTVAQNEAINRSIAESIDAQTTSWLQYKVAVESAQDILAGGKKGPVDEFDASTWFDSGGDNAFGLDASGIPAAIQTAVDAATGIIEGFTSPDDVYQAVVDMDIQAVIDGTANANSLLDSIQDKTVTIHFATSGGDDVQDAIDEFGG